MSMVHPWTKAAGWVVAVMLLCLGTAAPRAAHAQGVHYQHQSAVPPGAIGRWQLQRGGPLSGYFQPVEIKAPPGALISLAVEGQFEPPAHTPVLAGMLIGSVYRLRIVGIPVHEGAELFPTVEVIDRMYPPVGKAWHFPIQIELTQQDLELALAGRFVTRVVYLEEPESAVPTAEAGSQLWLDARPGENPLEVADGFGRPMAIVRLGGRLPTNPSQPDAGFLYGSPPVTKVYWPQPVAPPAAVLPPPVVRGSPDPAHGVGPQVSGSGQRMALQETYGQASGGVGDPRRTEATSWERRRR